jgi:hypothetical protein
MPNFASLAMRLSSSAGPLPTVKKGARFPLPAGTDGMDPKRLINNQIPDDDMAIFKAKTQFSAVGSGIGEVSTRAGEARLREIITTGRLRDLHRDAETPFDMILEARP